MDLGTSIFLSAILIGMIILFISTKDRWNWKKIVLSFVLLVVSLSILSGVGYLIYPTISNRPKPQTSFWDISLDSTKSDLKFLKGPPIKGSDATHWFYSNKPPSNTGEDAIIHIGFKDEKIHFISYEGDYRYGPSLQGVYNRAPYREIIKKFGQPSSVSISEDELERILSYDKYNTFFQIRENKVIRYGVYNKTFGPVKYPKEKTSAPEK